MSQADEIFTFDELHQLTMVQLSRVLLYLTGETPPENLKKSQAIRKIMEIQRPVSGVPGNPDWADGIPRSVRVQRIYEANKLGKRI